MHKQHRSPVAEVNRHVLASREIEARDSDHLLSVEVERYIDVTGIASAVVSDGDVMSLTS